MNHRFIILSGCCFNRKGIEAMMLPESRPGRPLGSDRRGLRPDAWNTLEAAPGPVESPLDDRATLDPTANAMITGIATSPTSSMVDGRAMPDAKVQMTVGSKTVDGLRRPLGPVPGQDAPEGRRTYQVKVKAE